jgi:glutathione S-transferase
MAWIRSDLGPIREERSAEYVFYPHHALAPFAPLSPAGQRAAAKLLAAADALVPADSGPLFGAWCVADTDLAVMLQRLLRTRHEIPAHMRAYAEAQWLRSAVQEFLRRPRPTYKAALV